jgi:hypothetical protein
VAFISLMPADQVKVADRNLGLLIAISGSIAFLVIRSFLHRRELYPRASHPSPGIDEIHSVRYALMEKLTHSGSCHCERIQFRIRAPRILNAFDMQCKVRFPRLVIKCEDFENMSDESNLSLYAVTNGSHIGIHAFCSFCGVHILFSPAEDPKEIQINVDCLDRNAVETINVSYYGKNESIACDLSDARARLYTRTRLSSLVTDVALPPVMSRTPSRGLTHHEIQQLGPLNDSDYCSESLSELLVEGVDDAESEVRSHPPFPLNCGQKEFSREALQEDLRERIEASSDAFSHKQHGGTPGSSRYRRSVWMDPSREDRDTAALSRSWHSTGSNWKYQTQDSSNSNSLSNSYTTADSFSANDSSSKDERQTGLGQQRSHWNPSVGLDTPTTALHRRLKTFLRRHMPPGESASSAATATLVSSRLDQQHDLYDPGRWRR